MATKFVFPYKSSEVGLIGAVACANGGICSDGTFCPSSNYCPTTGYDIIPAGGGQR